jgi:EpsI family protein
VSGHQEFHLDGSAQEGHPAPSLSGTPAIALVLLVAAFAWCYGAVITAMAGQWWSNTIYNYGFLIPGIAAYMVWTERAVVVRAIGAPSYRAGVPMVLLGLALLIAGQAGSLLVVEEFSILPTIAGLVLLAGGGTLLRAVAFPLAYLLFMIPFWEVVTSRLHYPLQISSAVIAEWILRATHIPVHRTEMLLALPTVTLKVAEACSGVNFLVAIAAIALPYVYLSVASHTRRLIVVLFALFVAMASNGLRVALIGISQQFSWWDDLHGPGHLLHGMVVAVAGYAALFVGAHFLGGSPSIDAPPPAPGRRGARPTTNLARALVCAAVLLAIGASMQSTVRAVGRDTVGDPSEVPMAFGDWVAVGADVDQSAVRATGADHELARTYRSPTLGEAHLYVGYYAAQAQGSEFGSPAVDAGASTSTELALTGGEHVRIAEARVSGPPERAVVYWYDVNGSIVPDSLRAKGLTIWNGLLHRRSNGALVSVTLDPSAGLDRAQAQAAARAVAQVAVPAVRRYLAVSR